MDPTAPISVCRGASHPLACALTRALRTLWMRDQQWELTQYTAQGYAMSERLTRAALVLVIGGAAVAVATRLA